MHLKQFAKAYTIYKVLGKEERSMGRSYAEDGWSSHLWLNFACGYLMNMAIFEAAGCRKQ